MARRDNSMFGDEGKRYGLEANDGITPYKVAGAPPSQQVQQPLRTAGRPTPPPINSPQGHTPNPPEPASVYTAKPKVAAHSPFGQPQNSHGTPFTVPSAPPTLQQQLNWRNDEQARQAGQPYQKPTGLQSTYTNPTTGQSVELPESGRVLGIVSLILGVLGLLLFATVVPSIFLLGAAGITSLLSLVKLRGKKGKGPALAGCLMSLVLVALVVFVLVHVTFV